MPIRLRAAATLTTVAVAAILSAAAPVAAKTLVYCSEGSPENFYPAINTTGTSFDASSEVYRRLVDFERGTTKVIPSLAESWDIGDDGKSYVFHLRKGVKWHTSRTYKPTRDFNADDVLFSFDRQWKEDNAFFKVTSSNHTYFNDMALPKLLKSIDKVDDYTVKFTLNQPEAPFLADLAMAFAAIQSKEYADAMMKAGTPEKLDQEPIGNGPFYLLQYQKDATIRYRAFPEYWEGKAKLDDVVFSITPDASVRWAKLQKGECHVMPYPNPADLDAIRKDPNVTVLEQAGLNIGYLAYNTQKKPFDDVRVRKAFDMAINKKAIIDAVYLSTGIPAINPIPPSMWSYNDTVKDDPYDPEAAKKLLAEAGFPNGFETDIWAMPVQRPYNPNARRIAELMQGRSRQGGGEGRDQELRVGRVPQAHAERRAPDRHARLDRRQRRSGQLPAHPARLRRRGSRRRQRRQVVQQGVRGPRAEGQGHQRSGRAHQAVRTGAGRVQARGPVVHHRACGADQADPQGGGGLHAVAVRPPHLLRGGPEVARGPRHPAAAKRCSASR